MPTAGLPCVDDQGRLITDIQGRATIHNPSAPDCECEGGTPIACAFARMQFYGTHRRTQTWPACGSHSFVEEYSGTFTPPNVALFATPAGCPRFPDGNTAFNGPGFSLDWLSTTKFPGCPAQQTPQLYQCDDYVYYEVPAFAERALVISNGSNFTVRGTNRISAARSPIFIYSGESSIHAGYAGHCEHIGETDLCTGDPGAEFLTRSELEHLIWDGYGQYVQFVNCPDIGPCPWQLQFIALGTIEFEWSLIGLFDPDTDLQQVPGNDYSRVRRSKVGSVSIRVNLPNITVTSKNVDCCDSQVTDELFIGQSTFSPAITDGPTSRGFEIRRQGFGNQTGSGCVADPQTFDYGDQVVGYGNIEVFG